MALVVKSNSRSRLGSRQGRGHGAQLKARVACILSSAKSRDVSKNLVRGLKRVCKVALKKRGAASGLWEGGDLRA